MPPAPPKILVIDDEPNVCEVLSEGLKTGGFDVETAPNGASGVIRALEFRPDLILLDIMMPKLDGWQTLQRLRRYHETSRIPVVMLTAKSETRDVLRARDENVLDYIIKPIEIQELIKFAQRYIYRG